MRNLLFILCFCTLPAFCAAQALPVAPSLPPQEEESWMQQALLSEVLKQNMAPITVQFPYEGQRFGAGVRRLIVHGKLHVPNAQLEINGVSAAVRPDGRFMAYVPVSGGEGALLLVARSGEHEIRAVRHIVIAEKKPQTAAPWESFAPCAAEVTQQARLRTSHALQGNLCATRMACGEVVVDGRKGRMCRISLGGGESAWLEEKYLQFKGPPPAHNRIASLKLQTNQDESRLVLPMTRQVPLSVRALADRLEFTLYYTSGFDERAFSSLSDGLVRAVSWSRLSGARMRFTLWLQPSARLWGFDYTFKDGAFVMTLRRAPRGGALKGAKILLDPGHSGRRQPPYDGTVGPGGYTEFEAALDLARDLKTALEREGAQVQLTRTDNVREVSLPQRREAARAVRPDVLISLHYDALPATVNPATGKRGFSVYYSYPHSRALARAVHSAYLRHVPLPDSGLHQTDFLFIPRLSAQPTVLVENAFLMFPEQEDLARTPQGRAVFVRALVQGLRDFYAGLP